METLLPLITAIALLHFGKLYFPAVVSEKVAAGLHFVASKTADLPMTRGIGGVVTWVIIPALIFMLFLFWVDYVAGSVVRFLFSTIILMWVLSAYHLKSERVPAESQQLFLVIHELSTWFWYVILGPIGLAGALVSLLIFYFAQNKDLSETHQQLFKRAERLWQWLPARLVALSFALSGHFVKTFSVWRGLFCDKTLAAHEVVEPCLMAAVGDTANAEEIQDCLVRTKMIWLAALLLMLFAHAF